MLSKLNKAVEIAALAHKDQVRNHSGIPYLAHLFDVVKRLSHYGFSECGPLESSYADDILSAAMLHDIIEDQIDKISIDCLKKIFGEKVVKIVEECTRDDSGGASKKHKWEFLCSFANKSQESVAIKIADRYCNVLDFWDTDKKYAAKYALQAWPLYSVFVRKSSWPSEITLKIQDDIRHLSEIIGSRYDIRKLTTIEDIKELVI